MTTMKPARNSPKISYKARQETAVQQARAAKAVQSSADWMVKRIGGMGEVVGMVLDAVAARAAGFERIPYLRFLRID